MTHAATKPWCYDLLFDDIRKAWDDHDKTCESLLHMWLGHKGGVSCLSDYSDCDDCGVAFFWEGLRWINWDRKDEDEIHLCECCKRKREGLT